MGELEMSEMQVIILYGLVYLASFIFVIIPLSFWLYLRHKQKTRELSKFEMGLKKGSIWAFWILFSLRIMDLLL